MITPSTVRIVRGIAAMVATVFGVATLAAGFRVLLGSDPGYFVFRPLLIFNTMMGAVYVAAGVTIWRSLRWGTYAAGGIFVINLLVLAGVALLYRSDGPVAVDSVRAMTLRTVVWLVLFVVVLLSGRGLSVAPASGDGYA